MAHGLLVIYPKRKRRSAAASSPVLARAAVADAAGAVAANGSPLVGAGTEPGARESLLSATAGAVVNADVAQLLVNGPTADGLAAPSPSAEGLPASRWPGEDRDTSWAILSQRCAARSELHSAGAESGASNSLPAPALAAHGAGTIVEATFEHARPTVGRANLWRRLLRQALHLIRGGPLLH